jgi:hypothetical protein
MLNYLHFKMLYSSRQNLDALFLINLYRNKVDCCSIVDTVGLRVPTKQTRNVATFKVSNVSSLSPSTWCVAAANNICRSVDVFNRHNISLEDTFPLLNPTKSRHYYVTCIILLPRIKF